MMDDKTPQGIKTYKGPRALRARASFVCAHRLRCFIIHHETVFYSPFPSPGQYFEIIYPCSPLTFTHRDLDVGQGRGGDGGGWKDSGKGEGMGGRRGDGRGREGDGGKGGGWGEGGEGMRGRGEGGVGVSCNTSPACATSRRVVQA